MRSTVLPFVWFGLTGALRNCCALLPNQLRYASWCSRPRTCAVLPSRLHSGRRKYSRSCSADEMRLALHPTGRRCAQGGSRRQCCRIRGGWVGRSGTRLRSDVSGSRVLKSEVDTTDAEVRGGGVSRKASDFASASHADSSDAFSRTIELQGIPLTSDIWAILVVYFVQGALGLARLATTFFLKDELHLAPAEVAALSGLFTLPWVLKPLYGFLSDGVPLFGYRRWKKSASCADWETDKILPDCMPPVVEHGPYWHLLNSTPKRSRRSYMMLAGLIGSSGWFYLANYAHTPLEATVASIVASLGVAVSDVVADSIVVEKARDSNSQAISGGLQSLCWGSAAIGGIVSAYFSGALLERMSPREVFSLTAILPLLITGCAFFIEETRKDKSLTSPGSAVSGQVGALWSAIKQKSVWLPAAFIFMWQATPSSDAAFLYFLTNDIAKVTSKLDGQGQTVVGLEVLNEDGSLFDVDPLLTSTPGVGKEFLGRIRLGSSVASLIGVWIFQTFLKETKISLVLFWTALASVPLGFTQLVLVYHLNRQLGIPDELFTFGDDVVLAVLGQLAFMPTLVLAARLCPPGVEGTLFALLMSIFNGGGIVGSELGALLTRVMGVTDVDFRNLGMLIVVCNLSSLLPLPFLKWIDAVETEEAEQLKDGGSLDKQNP